MCLDYLRKSACQYFVTGFKVTACQIINTACKYSISVGVKITVYSSTHKTWSATHTALLGLFNLASQLGVPEVLCLYCISEGCTQKQQVNNLGE